MALRGRATWFGVVLDAPDGPELADFQPQTDVRVMLDPAGHSFCVCRNEE